MGINGQGRFSGRIRGEETRPIGLQYCDCLVWLGLCSHLLIIGKFNGWVSMAYMYEYPQYPFVPLGYAEICVLIITPVFHSYPTCCNMAKLL